MDELSAATDRIRDAIQDAITAGELGDGSGMVTGYVVAISYVDSDGEHCHATLSSDDIPASHKIGLVRVAQLGLDESVRAWWWGDD